MKTVADLMELLGVVPFLAKPMEEKLNLILFIFFHLFPSIWTMLSGTGEHPLR